MSLVGLGSISSALISLAALAVAVISLVKTNRFNTRQNEFAETTKRLNDLLIEREATERLSAKKADVSANLYQVGRHSYRLKVFNRGKGAARNVRLIDLCGENSILDGRGIDAKFPLKILDPQQSVEVVAVMSFGSAEGAHIRLEWDDDAGVDHEKELTPSL